MIAADRALVRREAALAENVRWECDLLLLRVLTQRA